MRRRPDCRTLWRSPGSDPPRGAPPRAREARHLRLRPVCLLSRASCACCPRRRLPAAAASSPHLHTAASHRHRARPPADASVPPTRLPAPPLNPAQPVSQRPVPPLVPPTVPPLVPPPPRRRLGRRPLVLPRWPARCCRSRGRHESHPRAHHGASPPGYANHYGSSVSEGARPSESPSGGARRGVMRRGVMPWHLASPPPSKLLA